MTGFSPGDVIEIEMPKGLAYLQVSHNHPSYPEIVRALPGLHEARPADLDHLVAGKSAFVAMIPLQGALHRGSLQGARCGTFPVPAADSAFPTFRMAIRDRNGAVVYWWFWDGESLRYDADPGPDIEALPIREVLSAEALLERLMAVGATA